MADPRAIEAAAECPKCGYTSGNDWTQCKGDCPMPMSPHYKAAQPQETPQQKAAPVDLTGLVSTISRSSVIFQGVAGATVSFVFPSMVHAEAFEGIIAKMSRESAAAPQKAVPEDEMTKPRFFASTVGQKVIPDAEGLIKRLVGPHEWGYRDLTDASFIADTAPYEAADALPQAAPAQRQDDQP